MTSVRYRISLLAFAAYPGEAEICCGGMLAKAAKCGHQAGVIDLSLAELSAKGSVEDRAKEAGLAADILKLTYRGNLGIPHGLANISGHEVTQLEQLRKVVALVRKMRPEVVLIPYASESDPDHAAVKKLLDRAILLAGFGNFDVNTDDAPHTVRQVLYYGALCQFEPSFVCDVTDAIEQKLNSIRCYKNELLPDDSIDSGETVTLGTSPMTLRSIEARDAYYGALIGVGYAEPYICNSLLSLSDPVAHFRENPISATVFKRS